jgi:hypothetical protein
MQHMSAYSKTVATAFQTCVTRRTPYTTYAVAWMTMLGLVFVPIPLARPTSWTRKLTNVVHALAKTISGSVSAKNWHHTGSDHIWIGITMTRVTMARRISLRNWRAGNTRNMIDSLNRNKSEGKHNKSEKTNEKRSQTFLT